MDQSDDLDDIEGGETSCFAHLLCPECGAVTPNHTLACTGPTDELDSRSIPHS